MPIAEVASLVGGAALGAPFSEILKLVIGGAKKVKDFKPLSEDLASTMESLVPIFEEIDTMQRGSGTDELKFLIKTIKRAEEMVHKCSGVQWYSVAKRALYSKEIKEINEDFVYFCGIELQLIQLRNQLQHMNLLASVTTKVDLLSITKESSELFLVPLPQEVTVCWLGRPLRELKKVLFEDGVVSTVVFASSACGKTSLVTKLCHDADVKGKFKHILFITVSKAPNIRLIVQKLLELTGCNANEFASNFDARLCIQQLLMQLRQSGSVLFVLDDVWPEEESLLEKFLIQLTDYKILVTSRFEFPSFGPTFHLEPLIDEDVKNLFFDFAPHPNCASCSKLDHSIQKILKGCNGLPLAMNRPCSIFDSCSSVIEHGSSGDVLGALLHHKCLQCDACHKPIATQETENHVSNSRGKFHKACYGRYCYVCKEKVKIRMFSQHPFWKENYCPAHGSDGTPKCCSCERLEPRGTNYVRLCDGRWLCLECMESAVMDTDEVQPLHFEIREFFEGLNMRIEKEFPLLMVGKQALNKAEEDEKIDYQSEVVTRALCLSEDQQVAKAVEESLKMEEKRKQSEEQVKKDEQLARIVQENLNTVESPPLRAESRRVSRRAPLDEDEQLSKALKESLKEVSKGKKFKDEQLSKALKESLKEVSKGKKFKDEQVKKDEQFDEKEFPLLMVGKQALNKAEEDEKIDYQSEVVTRALCLSEELTISAVSKRPRMGPNRQLIGIVTESQKVVRRKCEITAILIIYGLPKILTGYLLACEMMRAWLRLKGHRNLDKVLEAGICQVVGHMWLESYTYASTDASGSKEPVCSVFEKRLVEFCKNQIETDDSRVYGVGFKRVNQMVTHIGLQKTLRKIIRRS